MARTTTHRELSDDVRQARRAVGLLFITNGAILANLVPRLPAIKDDLGLSRTQYGASILAMPIGGLLAGIAAAWLIRRLGALTISVYGTAAAALAMMAAGAAPVWILFVAALALAGMMDAVVDVSQNASGLAVQEHYGRSIINSFHAMWSLGAVIGGGMGAGAAYIGLPRPIHLGISAVIFTSLAVLAAHWLGPFQRIAASKTRPSTNVDQVVADDDLPVVTTVSPTMSAVGVEPEGTPTTRTTRPAVLILLGLSLIAICGALVEDVGSTWATLYLRDERGAPEGLAGIGFVALMAAHFAGRMSGDALVTRWGQRTVVRSGGVLMAVGMGAALAWPTVPMTVLGFACAGFGVATLVPLALEAANEVPGLKEGTGLAVVSWLLRVGFFASPPVLGLISDHWSLRVALLILPVGGLAVIAFASLLPPAKADGAMTPGARQDLDQSR